MARSKKEWVAHWELLWEAYQALGRYANALEALAEAEIDYGDAETWEKWAEGEQESEAELRVQLGCTAYFAGRRVDLLRRSQPDFDGDWSWCDAALDARRMTTDWEG